MVQKRKVVAYVLDAGAVLQDSPILKSIKASLQNLDYNVIIFDASDEQLLVSNWLRGKYQIYEGSVEGKLPKPEAGRRVIALTKGNSSYQDSLLKAFKMFKKRSAKHVTLYVTDLSTAPYIEGDSSERILTVEEAKVHAKQGRLHSLSVNTLKYLEKKYVDLKIVHLWEGKRTKIFKLDRRHSKSVGYEEDYF